MPKRVLYVSHNHPSVRPGGAEAYALALHRTLADMPGWESTFLARSGPPLTAVTRYHDGTHLSLVGDRPDEYFFHTELAHFDTFLGCTADKYLWTHYLRDFLRVCRPDVVHFQHTLYLGYDMIREVRNTLPDAALVYTLHDFNPICHHHGQMVRPTSELELCTHSSPRRCHECFPEHSPQDFFMRKRFAQAMFDLVDQFIAPSEFLWKRYIDWGIPPEKIKFEENGCALSRPAFDDSSSDRPRNRFGFFGQLTQFKGIHILLDAMKRVVAADDDAHLFIHGANLELQSSEFRSQMTELLVNCRENVTVVGRYEPQDLPALMANIDWVVVPSIWWENSPLVIQEAFLHGRPVICGDIGGMAEKVANGVNGLHFRARDSISLADTLRRAMAAPDLWRALRAGIPAVYSMQDHAASLIELYQDLIARKRPMANVAVLS
jgi:glycosyltransferase involved in cell wall biosynthesis